MWSSPGKSFKKNFKTKKKKIEIIIFPLPGEGGALLLLLFVGEGEIVGGALAGVGLGGTKNINYQKKP